MYYFAKDAINFREYNSSSVVANNKKVIAKELSRIGFIESLVDVRQDYLSSTYSMTIRYDNKIIAYLTTKVPNGGYYAAVEMLFGKDSNNIVSLAFIVRKIAVSDWYYQDPYSVSKCIFSLDNNEVISIDYTSNSGSIQNDEYVWDYFSPVNTPIDLENNAAGKEILGSYHIDKYGQWNEIIRTNFKAELFKKYTIDNENYLCISGSNTGLGGVFAKLTKSFNGIGTSQE